MDAPQENHQLGKGVRRLRRPRSAIGQHTAAWLLLLSCPIAACILHQRCVLSPCSHLLLRSCSCSADGRRLGLQLAEAGLCTVGVGQHRRRRRFLCH